MFPFNLAVIHCVMAHPQSPPVTSAYPAGTILAGRYQVLSRLGDGGMGEVYLVHDPVVDAKVALKLLHANLVKDKRSVDRFSQELRLTREITTDYIVRTHDVGEHEGRRFFVMEYSDRGSLKSRISEGVMPFSEVVSLLIDMCRGLKAIHEKGVIHRDLKPDNIMLFTNADKSGIIAKITDFGIARQGVSGLTGPTEVLGSIHYMSPEAWTGQSATPAMDLYSLGCMAYQMASGVLPFDGDIPAEVMFKHTQVPPTPLIEITDDIPRWFHELVMRLLEKDPLHRYASANEVLSVLTQGGAAPWRAQEPLERAIASSRPATSPTLGYSDAMRAPAQSLPTWEKHTHRTNAPKKGPLLWSDNKRARLHTAMQFGSWLLRSLLLLGMVTIAVLEGLWLMQDESLRVPFLILSPLKLWLALIGGLIGYAALMALPFWGAAMAARFSLRRQVRVWMCGTLCMAGLLIVVSGFHVNQARQYAFRQDRKVRPIWYLAIEEAASVQVLEASFLSVRGTRGTFRISPPVMVWLRDVPPQLQPQSIGVWLLFIGVSVWLLMAKVIGRKTAGWAARLSLVLMVPSLCVLLMSAPTQGSAWRIVLGRFDQSIYPLQLCAWSVGWALVYSIIARTLASQRRQQTEILAQSKPAPLFSKHARGG